MMTSRERILADINHQSPDQVSVDLGATPGSGISAITYSNLVKHIAREDLPVRIYDVVQQLAQPDRSVLNHFGVDVLDIGHTFNNIPSNKSPVMNANGAASFYPKWFQPARMADCSYQTYDDDAKRINSCIPIGATFFDQTYFPYVDGYPDSYVNAVKEFNNR